MEKIVKTRVDHKCGHCNKIIKAGTKAFYMEGRYPKFEGNGFDEKQIGIEYFKVYLCHESDGDTCPSCAFNGDNPLISIE